MSATLLAFPMQPAHTHSGTNPWPLLTSGSSNSRRLEQLEQLIPLQNNAVLLTLWVNEYLDIGLDLAAEAGSRHLPALQESWLRRLYSHLRNTAFADDCNPHCRQLCLESLYQPFFALRHLYRQQPQGRLCIRRLSQDLSASTRYLI